MTKKIVYDILKNNTIKYLKWVDCNEEGISNVLTINTYTNGNVLLEFVFIDGLLDRIKNSQFIIFLDTIEINSNKLIGYSLSKSSSAIKVCEISL